MSGPNTRAIHAGVPPGEQGEPLLPGPVLAAPYHLRGDKDAAPYGYGRDENPSWTHLERALGELDGGESTVFASGMAAVTAVLFTVLKSGDVLVACGDGYPGIRGLARERLEPLGVETRLVPTTEIADAAEGASLVWLETPSNPRLDVVDIAAAAEAAHAAGALLAVDNTVCTPLGQQPLAHGADFAMLSGTKSLCGHSDVLLGAVSVRDGSLAEGLRRWRTLSGAIAGGFEAWLAHRSLATLGLRLERSSANAAARGGAAARARRRRGGLPPGRVAVRWTSRGPSWASTSAPRSAPRRSSRPARWSPRPRASAACTRRPSAAAGGGPTPCRRGSSASPRGARTRTTCSPTSSALSTRRNVNGAG